MFDNRPVTDWLPITKKEVEMRGWDELDVILISGDAYVDHPAFGSAVIGRIIESEGLRIAIVPQPNWKDDLRDFKKMGRPKLFFGIIFGLYGSYDQSLHRFKKKAFDGRLYTWRCKLDIVRIMRQPFIAKILKKLYPDVPVLIGGIEASLRRVTHYDYWEDKLFPNILEMSGADLVGLWNGRDAIKRNHSPASKRSSI